MGAARSGTTLFRLMLNRHPRLAVPPESHFLLRLFEQLPINRKLSPEEVRQAAEIIIRHPRFRTWHINEDRLRASFDEIGPCHLRELVDCAFRLEVARTAKPRWGDKTPAYSDCWEQIAELYPDARLIHIIRDGRDVSASLGNVGWHGRTEYERAKYWSSRVSLARECERRLGPQRCLTVRYEDLVLDTEETLKRVCSFLEEDYAPAMTRFYEDSLDHVSDFDGPVHGKLNRPPEKDDVDCWRNDVSRVRILLFESVAGRAMDALCYERYFGGRMAGLMPVIGQLYPLIGVHAERAYRFFHRPACLPAQARRRGGIGN